MVTPENHTKSKEAKSKVDHDQGRSQTKKTQKNMAFTPITKIAGVWGELEGQNLLGNWFGKFKATLDNITIYVGANYGHEMDMALKTQKEAVIPQPEKPEDDASESDKYIWKLK